MRAHDRKRAYLRKGSLSLSLELLKMGQKTLDGLDLLGYRADIARAMEN